MKIGLVGKGNVVRPTPNVIQCSRDDSGQARVGHPPNAGICRHPVHDRPVNASLLGTAPKALLAVWVWSGGRRPAPQASPH